MLRSDFTSLRRHVGLPCLLFFPPFTEAHVRYNLVLLPHTIRSALALMYNINLRATSTTILSIRGVTIPIYLVSSATDSIRWCVVLFKPVPIPTSDLKSEFLCQSSLLLHRTYRPPWTPCTPGISPTPPPPCIIHTVIALVLWLSIWSRSSVPRELSILVAASPLKPSRMFHSNVTRQYRTERLGLDWIVQDKRDHNVIVQW